VTSPDSKFENVYGVKRQRWIDWWSQISNRSNINRVRVCISAANDRILIISTDSSSPSCFTSNRVILSKIGGPSKIATFFRFISAPSGETRISFLQVIVLTKVNPQEKKRVKSEPENSLSLDLFLKNVD